MKISIDKAVLNDFPQSRIGWLKAEVIVEPESELINNFKKQLILGNISLKCTF